MSNKCKIFVIYHKPETALISDVYQPLAVGKNASNFPNEFLRDNVGENISEKNPIYNEMTGIYWVFRHLDEFKDTQYFGFAHYRRLFCFNGLDKTAYVKKEFKQKLIEVDEDKIGRNFSDYDFIVPRPSHYRSVRKHFEKTHNKEDIDLLLKVIDEVAPKYKKDAEEYFDGGDEYLYNMFVFSKSQFEEYGNFIFPVLDKFVSEKKDIDRLYVSERLTGIFITHLLSEGKRALLLPILHIRSKSLKAARKQVKENFKQNKDRGLMYKLKPLILCFIPRFLEQDLRRRKARWKKN